MSNEDMDNLIARDQMQALQSTPQPSFGGITAPQDPGQIQALLQKLQQEQIAQRYASYGPGMADIARAGQSFGNAAGGILNSLAGTPQGPSPQQAQQQQIRQALMGAKSQYSDLVNNQGMDPDAANITVLKSLAQQGIPGADEALGKAQTTQLSNNDKISSDKKNTAQANAAQDEITNRQVQNDRNNAKDTWQTVQQTPGGAIIQKNGLGEVRVQQTQNASAQAAAAISPNAMQAMLDSYHTTGTVPPGLARSPALAGKFWEAEAASQGQTGNTAATVLAQKEAAKSYSSALVQTQKQLSATTSYVNTFDKNTQQVLDLSKGLDLSDVGKVNQAYTSWLAGTSDPKYVKYNLFFNAAANEFAKIQSGSLGNTPVSDSARHEAAATMSKYLGPEGVSALVSGMKQESQNRLASLADERDSLLTKLGGKPIGSSPKAAAAPAPAAPTAQGPVLQYDPSTGTFK